MPTSAAAKGSYFKARSKKWLEARGFTVAHLERLMLVWRPGQPALPIKRDQFGADLLAVSAQAIWFVQVKLGTKNAAAARKEFAKFPCPPPAQQVLMTWAPRARDPELEYMPSGRPAGLVESTVEVSPQWESSRGDSDQ